MSSRQEAPFLEPGSKVREFRVQSMLGRGGMGEVYLAEDEQLGRLVALKRIRPDLLSHPVARERFRREARLAARLTHPRVVQVFGFLSEQGADYLVLEYVEGVSLAHLVRSGHGLGARVAVRWLRQVAEGLAVAHGSGLVHRDLKAENILLTRDGDVKILDFGLARPMDASFADGLTRSGMRLGTLRVMAPEQAAGGKIDERSDLFSLGVLSYELLTGRSPFYGSGPEETLANILTRAPESVEGVPAELSRLMDRLLAKSPAGRPDSAQQVAEELSHILDGLESDSPAPLPRKVDGHLPEGYSQSPTEWTLSPTPPASEAEPEGGPPKGGNNRSAGPRRLRGPAIVALLLILGVGLGVFLQSRSNQRPIRVVMPEPGWTSPTDDVAGPLVLAAVRESGLNALARIPRLSVVDPAQHRGFDGSAMELAKAVSADELAVSEAFFDRDRFWVSLRRIGGRDGRVIWSDSFEAPVGRRDLLLLSEAVESRWRRAYGAGDSDSGPATSDEAYARFLELRAQIWDGGAGSPQEQLRILRELLEESPDFLAARLLAADLETNLFTSIRDPESLERAEADVERARLSAPDDPRIHYRAFRLAVLGGDLTAAEFWLKEFARAAPGDVEVSVARALLAESRGQLQEAVDHLGEAVAAHPSWANLYRLARLEQKVGRVESARAHLRQLLEAWPDSPWGLELSANLELQFGDLGLAEELLGRLIQARPSRPGWNNLGLTHYLRGEPKEAVAAYGRALELEPDHPAVLLNLADSLRALGDAKSAAQSCGRALEILASRPVGDGAGSYDRLMRAQCLVHIGDAEQAVTETLEALQAHGEDSEVAYQAAVVFAGAGDEMSAKASARRALELGLQPRWLSIPAFSELRRDPAFLELLGGGS